MSSTAERTPLPVVTPPKRDAGIDYELFLDCVHREQRRGGTGSIRREVCQYLREDETADPIINRSSDDPAGHQFFCGVGVNRGMTNPYAVRHDEISDDRRSLGQRETAGNERDEFSGRRSDSRGRRECGSRW